MNIKNIIQFSRPLILGSTILSVMTLYPLSVYAKDSKPWSIEGNAGIEYDSNVNVQEVDVDTGTGDYSARLDISANYEINAGESTTFEMGYSFSQSLHQDATSFDLQTHVITALAKHKFDGFDLGVNYLYINTSLGGNAFLQIHKASPYVSFFATPSIFVRAAYSYTDKKLKTSSDRDAQTHGIGSDIFYFMNRAKSYFMASYRYDSLDANADRFDYDGHDVKVRYQTKIPWSGREARFRIGGRYIKRNYVGITPSIGAVRNDERASLEGLAEIPFGAIWNATLKYRYTDATSNLAAADYKESLVTFMVGFEF